MPIIEQIAKSLAARRCEKLVEQTGNEITISGAKFGIANYSIDIGNISTKYVEFYKVTQIMIAMDSQQYLLCRQIAFEEDPDLKKTCNKIRIQSIYAFSQLQSLLALPQDQCKSQLDEWVSYMNQLARINIGLLGPTSTMGKSSASKDLREITDHEIFHYSPKEGRELKERSKSSDMFEPKVIETNPEHDLERIRKYQGIEDSDLQDAAKLLE